MLPHRMQQLRRMQFSTEFACFDPEELPPGRPADFWHPPDDRRQWAAACAVFASLRQLQYVHITITRMCQRDGHQHPRDDESMYDLLRELKAVCAVEFTVEVTDLAETVYKRLGDTPFALIRKDAVAS